MSVRIEVDDFGSKAVVTGSWTSQDRDVIQGRGVRRIQIAAGSSSLAFAKELGDVDEIEVIDHVLTSDAGVVAAPGIRALGLETYSQDPIDFRVFRQLERLHMNWRPKAETAFECTSLRSLSVGSYPFADLAPLSSLLKLEGLRIASARKLTTLEGVERMPRLSTLWLLDNRNLADLSSLQQCRKSLTELWLNRCRRVADLSPLRLHTELRRLALIDGGHISSLGPLADLPELEELWFYGTTIIDDGDMTPLLRMPSLKRVSFAPRRHYGHRLEDIARLLGLVDSVPLPHWRW